LNFERQNILAGALSTSPSYKYQVNLLNVLNSLMISLIFFH